jgi:hypothetical protein
MAHYAFLDENNIVQAVYVGIDENDLTELPENVSSWEEHYTNTQGMTCVRTSYNTYGNQHTLGGTPFRGNYAGKGDVYDTVNDVFYPPQPYPSWTLNTNTWSWEAPVERPTLTEEEINAGKYYSWNEETTSWALVTIPETP